MGGARGVRMATPCEALRIEDCLVETGALVPRGDRCDWERERRCSHSLGGVVIRTEVSSLGCKAHRRTPLQGLGKVGGCLANLHARQGGVMLVKAVEGLFIRVEV